MNFYLDSDECADMLFLALQIHRFISPICDHISSANIRELSIS